MAGRADVLDRLDFAAAAQNRAGEGTASGHVQRQSGIGGGGHSGARRDCGELTSMTRADATAATLRAAHEQGAGASEGVAWAVYGTSSGFHLFV